ncbi:MAG: hypothetical protein K2W96_22060, partial [Gemmataceae bacterium]|nr:hypothetical protein [Gemmataceae bacterium]
MRNIIVGSLGTAFGGGLLAYSLLRGAPFLYGGTEVSHWFGVGLGALMVLAGLLALVSGILSLNKPEGDGDRPARKRRPR